MSRFAFRIDDGRATAIDPDEAPGIKCGLVWVHLAGIEDDTQGWLRDVAKLDAYVVDALTAAETRPRCEAFGSGAFLNLRGRTKEDIDGSDLLASLRIWAVKGCVFSVSRAPLIAVGIVKAEVAGGDIRDPGDLITAFAGAITGDLDPDVAELGDRLDDCEEALDAKRVFEQRRTVAQVRRAAISYRRFLNPQRDALERLAALPGDWLGDDDRLHIAAAADRAARMAEELEAIRERSALMHEQLSDLRTEQIDQRSLIISVAAMVFLPLTFITGLYGMNVKGLPGAESPYAFDVIAIVCAVIAVAVTGWFVAKRWFR